MPWRAKASQPGSRTAARATRQLEWRCIAAARPPYKDYVASLSLRLRAECLALTTAHFSQVPVDVSPVEDVTYLKPARWDARTSAERMSKRYAGWALARYETRETIAVRDVCVRRPSAAPLQRYWQITAGDPSVTPENVLMPIGTGGQFLDCFR